MRDYPGDSNPLKRTGVPKITGTNHHINVPRNLVLHTMCRRDYPSWCDESPAAELSVRQISLVSRDKTNHPRIVRRIRNRAPNNSQTHSAVYCLILSIHSGSDDIKCDQDRTEQAKPVRYFIVIQFFHNAFFR